MISFDQSLLDYHIIQSFNRYSKVRVDAAPSRHFVSIVMRAGSLRSPALRVQRCEHARRRDGKLGHAHAGRCVHRVGLLELGECAVWIGVASPHRDEAFKACRYIIDEIKVRLPIWKKEHYVNGDSGWVNCERCAAHGIAD